MNVKTTKHSARWLVPSAIALAAVVAIVVPAACQRVEEPSVSPDPRGKPTVVADTAPDALAPSPTLTATAVAPVVSTAATAAACPPDPDPAGGRSLFAHGLAAFVTPDGRRHVVHAEIARSNEAHERGLMYRTTMGADDAMVFEFAVPQAARFWMHNTCMPLDMVFVGEDARVLGVVTAPALNDDARFVNGFSKWVVELPAGTAAREGIAMGTVFEAPK